MKKILIFLIFSATLSCSLYKNTEMPYFQTEQENYSYVVNQISYKLNPIDWPYPEEVVFNGYADCNGKTALLAVLFERNLGYGDIKLWICSIKGKDGAHMILENNGTFYETTSVFVTDSPNDYYNLISWMDIETYLTIADLCHPFD